MHGFKFDINPLGCNSGGLNSHKEEWYERAQGLPLAGFTRYGPAKKSTLTVLLEALGALGVLCMKTLVRLRSLRLASDQDAEKVALTRQSALKTGQSAAKFMHDIDAKVYRRHAAQFIGLIPDQVDLEVAKKMLMEPEFWISGASLRRANQR
ncbi:hypothetical protein [Polaromonas glacialis]|uniref:hypothetical protein n=1 Tax=Polaromonas glacialis TaxID=866564 RepID=UPI0012EC2E5B|nr:hypothetical protein [Polaromonas glacialis]